MSTSMADTQLKTIPMGGLAYGKDDSILKTFVGSCIAVCIYDEAKKIAGMAHVMLPKNITSKTTRGTKLEGKFADEAIAIIIEKLQSEHSDLKLNAKMAGGAKIFAHENDSGTLNIGDKNINGIRAILEEKKIHLVSQLVGAKNGRWVTFNCNNQRVIVKDKEGEKII